ncbi:hypothetical protein [Photobacterium leiognathi]|uniref:hypothetical protein n=1 Tax=Photobacterium leiognathi TaxID=553611 RepID=UPI002980F82F|nr:hypothetical protein [Photobacterium leiognathi]
MTSELIDINKYKKELKKGKTYLNSIAGLAVFSLSLGCLSFDNPQKVAFLCLPIVIGLILAMPEFSSVYQGKQLMKFAKNKEDKELIEKELYKQTNSVESNGKFILEMMVFIYSIATYAFILIYPDFITNFIK